MAYDFAIDGYLAKFRAKATGTQQLSELEEKVIKLLLPQTEVLQEKLADHWLTSRLLSLWSPWAFWPVTPPFMAHGHEMTIMPRVANIQAATSRNRMFCAQHRICIYLKNGNDASNFKNKSNKT